MKNISLLFGLLFTLNLPLSAAPDVSMDVCRFQSDAGSYIEVSLYIVGSSLICNAAQDHYGVSYLVMIADDQDSIVSGNKYNLSRTGYPAQDIFDVRRFTLKPNQYVVSIEVSDLQDEKSFIQVSENIQILSEKKTASQSDIQILANIKNDPDGATVFNKSGLYLEPLPFNYYYSSLDQLFVYFETYHANSLEGQPYVQYTIKPVAGDVPKPITTYKKLKKEDINVNVLQLDISLLISGSYLLEAVLYDGKQQLVESRQIAFARFNPVGDSIFMETAGQTIDFGFVSEIPTDSLNYTLRAMAPIVNSIDIEIMNDLLKKGSERAKRFFIHRFWTIDSGKYAGVAFQAYMKIARSVDKNYMSGFGYGFETDRGHIFLKYGMPNEVVTVEEEPSAPPYEIWIYNDFPATRQTNVRFLFYNPSLVKNGHELLHSTARGEVNNSRWEVMLYEDATLEAPAVGQKVMGDNFNRNARTYFEY